jgi:hypothetical protein
LFATLFDLGFTPKIQETGRFIGSYPAIPFELKGKSQPKPVIVVPVVGIVVVAIRHTAVLSRNSGIVPAAAAQHTVGPF